MSNQQIAKYLQSQRDTAISSFQTASGVHPRLRACFAQLSAFDFAAYRLQLHDEILQNVKYWQTPKEEKGGQSLDAILFEFNSLRDQSVEANAYGIIDWTDATPHIEGFDMGYSYDFPRTFDYAPGISLSFLQPLEDLLDPARIDELAEPEDDMEDVIGFQHLADAYVFSGLVIIHDVLLELMQQHIFANTGLKPAAQFLLGGHDTGMVYPLLSMPPA